MTDLLFEKQPYVQECDAVVISSEKKANNWFIELDRTCMFPEGGGQPSDIGFINDSEVIAVSSKDGKVFHECRSDFPIGETVHVKIDFKHRFTYMQLHSAEHIVSGCIYNEYGYKNVGFHMHDGIATIDISGEFIPEMISRIEYLANKAVTDNIKTEIFYPEDITKITIRKYPDVNEPIRVVKIGDVDSCGCCGVHVSRSGEIGLIKILSFEKHRGGTRMTLCCGKTAFDDYSLKHDVVTENASKLSVKPEGLSSAIDKYISGTEALKRRLSDIIEKYYSLLSEKLVKETDTKYFAYFSDIADSDELRRLSAAISERTDISITFGKNGDQLKYAVISKNTDVRPLAKELNSHFDGRGGGKPDICQGFIKKDSTDEIESFLKDYFS